jgi:ATP-dependent RNA helicase DeaD
MVEEYTSLDIAAALLKLQLDTGAEPERVPAIQMGDTGAEPGMVRFYIDIGRKQQIRPKDIVGAVAGETGIPGRAIGAINIRETCSFVDIPENMAVQVLEGMKGKTIRGFPVDMTPAQGRSE